MPFSIRGAPLSESEFAEINVLKLPVYPTTEKPSLPLPEAFFLHNSYHIVLVRKTTTADPPAYIIIDSLPMTSGEFFSFFSHSQVPVLRAGPYSNRFWTTSESRNPAGPRALQYRPSSSTCALFAVAASLGVYFRPSVTDFWMWRVVAPILRQKPFPGKKALAGLSNVIVTE